MRVSVPKSSGVESAFRRLVKKLNTCQKQINSSAAGDMKSGNYESAQKWIEVGRSVSDFTGRTTAFASEWKRLVKTTRIIEANNRPDQTSTGSTGKSTRTPTWRFCAPSLKALDALGGTATLDEIIGALQDNLAGTLTESDLKLAKARGIPRWHIAVQRCYRQCQKEGWIEKPTRRDRSWKITSKGKGVASGTS
jgi:hypothetical protein